MRLRVKTDDPGFGPKAGFVSSSMVRVWLDDLEISDNLTNLKLSAGTEGYLAAEISIALGGVDIDVMAPVQVNREGASHGHCG